MPTDAPTGFKGTPGEWELHYVLSDGAFSVIPSGDDFVICRRERNTRRSEECQANAKLIACAPELAEKMLKFYNCCLATPHREEAEALLKKAGLLL